MYIYKKVSKEAFIKAFEQNEAFSEEGLKVLFKHFTNLAKETGIPFELDVVKICERFAEYESIETYNDSMDTDFNYWSELNNHFYYVGDDGALVIE